MSEEIPEDLGIKIGTKAEVKWTELLTAQEQVKLESNINIEIAENLIELAKIKISEEQDKS